ncbi:MAG: NYN domain-containing protein, partial [Mariniphaga sp.]
MEMWDGCPIPVSLEFNIMENDLKLAVLIDGDNIPSAYVKEMMEEIAKYGNPTIKRIYGDWTKPVLNKW